MRPENTRLSIIQIAFHNREKTHIISLLHSIMLRERKLEHNIRVYDMILFWGWSLLFYLMSHNRSLSNQAIGTSEIVWPPLNYHLATNCSYKNLTRFLSWFPNSPMSFGNDALWKWDHARGTYSYSFAWSNFYNTICVLLHFGFLLDGIFERNYVFLCPHTGLLYDNIYTTRGKWMRDF